MRSPKPITVVIACPHCGTRYQVPPETLGKTGRKVACAHCGQSWMADPGSALPVPEPDDRLFNEADEKALDKSFADEEAALRDVPAYDQVVQGMSGMMSITGAPDTAPYRVGYPVADTLGGLTAAMAVCAALVERDRVGGRFIDVSMLEIYNEGIRDLLSDPKEATAKKCVPP